MIVALAQLVAETASIVDRLTWSTVAVEAQSLDFVFLAGGRQIPARLSLSPDFPAELPEVHLTDDALWPALAHVDDKGKLCFSTEEGLSLSLWDPNAVLRDILHDAHGVLVDSLFGDSRRDILNELHAYWRLRAETPEIHLACEPDDRVRRLDCWRRGGETVLLSDRAHGRMPLGQHLPGTNNERRAIYLPISAKGFGDRAFIDAVAAGEVPLRRLLRTLDHDGRRQLKSLLRKRRRFDFLVFGVATSAGQRVALGVELDAAHGRQSFEAETALGRERWSARSLTRVDRAMLLPRGGVDMSSEGAHAIVVGCGALGGHVAEAIARTGLRRLTLVDPERLGVENIYRHTLGFAEVGASKAAALAARLRAALPHLEIDARAQRGEQLDAATLNAADLVLVTVGTPTVHRVLNRKLHGRRCRVVYGWLEPLGIGGHALLTSSGGGPGCIECLFVGSHGQERLTAWSDFAAPGQDFARQHTGCAGASTPFADLDARRTANLVVELGLGALAEREGPGSLRAWLGLSERFVSQGFELSRYHQRGELIEDFRQTLCPICVGPR